MTHPPRFRALIIGGSVAGLTLAHAFSRLNIDFQLIEAREHIAPFEGQSLIINPSAARILDQLGLQAGVEELGQALRDSMLRRSDGRLVSKVDWPAVVSERLGYDHIIIQRQAFLSHLESSFSPETRSKIHTSKRVASIVSTPEEVTVHCTDGSSYAGHVVIGADGVHSTVRKEMRRHAVAKGCGELFKGDEKSMSASYSCIFGISPAHAGLKVGEMHTTSDIDQSALLFVGKNDILLWFFVSKMDRTYAESEIPRYSEHDAEEMVRRCSDFQLAQGVSLCKLWEERSSWSCVPLEEAFYERWSFERFVCLGDAVHKMTPNFGQGGNQAIESAAVLTSMLYSLLQNSPQPSLSSLTTTLQTYQSLRQKRANFVTRISNRMTRQEAHSELAYTLQFLYFRAEIDSRMAEFNIKLQSGGPLLQGLEVPERGRREGWIVAKSERPRL